MIGVALAGVGAFGLIDVALGAEISFSIFYVLPVSLVTWYAGIVPGIWVALVSAATWMVADLGAGAAYSGPLIPYWNSLVRLGYFLIIVRLLTILRERLVFEERLADTDPLTGLANARAFLEAFATEQARLVRYGHPYSLAYLDLDDFKGVNDTRGHAAGDGLLRDVGSALRAVVRRTDRVGRLGGDEFAVLLPETAALVAEPVFKKLREAVTDTMVPVGGRWGLASGA